MSSERDPLLVAPSWNHENVQGLEETREKKLGPLEVSRSNRWAILGGIWIANFLACLNSTLVATLLPSISSEFNKSHQISWVGTAYLLATCAFTPLYGRLSDAMGRRGANQTAVLFAALGTLACGLSPSMNFIIAARFFAGIGGGGIFTTAAIITSDMFSLRSRGLAQSISNIFTGAGLGLGGPLGGLISDRYGWRAAFLVQLPLFLLSFVLTGYNLRYVTPGKGKTSKEVLKRIDYGGIFTTLAWVFSALAFLSYRYNEQLPWDDTRVISTLAFAILFFLLFLLVELKLAVEPVLVPSLLKQKIPVLVGINNFLVAICNFSIMYFFPMWFQTVMLSSASTAGLHLLPDSISMSVGSIFAGWFMHRTGKYRTITLTFGILPFVAAALITTLREDSSPTRLWFSIAPMGFGNAITLQTMLIALLAHIPKSTIAIGTGFSQLFKSFGQVGGVAISSAIFQSVLDRELRKRIHGPGSPDIIKRIRESARLVISLPPGLQRDVRDSYDVALKNVFVMATCSTFAAYIVRLAIPEKSLDESDPAIPHPQNPPVRSDVENVSDAVLRPAATSRL
ncbi:vacuolar amino acid permease [Thelephora terrestris]|uniref:Vacuolar amino acid permease n=1 Tax=Thelephora terrestris TaxID=56493 RepID=A0A9P6H9B4_9AGAM|nr:vacuolar amino acid permease [Thelephora terrestris]